MNKYDALKAIFPTHLKSRITTADIILRIISKPTYNLKVEIGCTSTTAVRIMDKLAPDRNKGENVCGLHVEDNLQYLTAFDNVSKGNKFSS